MSALRSRALLVALILTLTAASQRPVWGQAPAKPAKDSSLAYVPADAAFFAAGLRWKEQIDLFYRSRSYKALRSLPSVKKAYDEAMKAGKGDGGPLSLLEGFTKSDLAKDIIQIVTEAGSDEMFVFGGSNWNTLLQLLTAVNQAQTVGTYGALLSGKDPNTSQYRAILRALQKNTKLVGIPESVIGFRLATPNKADKLIDQLAKIGIGLTIGVKELEDRIQTKKIAGGKFLSVDLDGSQIDWNMLQIGDLEEKKGEFDGLIADLKKVKLNASVGVIGNYLLVSVGSTTKELEAFAANGKKLIDADALKVLRDVGDQRFTGFAYSSKEFVEAAGGSYAKQYADLLNGIKDSLKGADLKEERKKAIGKEIDELVGAMEKMEKVAFGSAVSYGYMTSFGYESLVHDRTSYSGLEKVKFKMHEHFGGKPIFATAFGLALDTKYYTEFVQFGKKVLAQAQAIYLDSADANAADEYKKITKAVFPVLEQIDATMTKKIIPAMSQTGLGIVLDGQWTSKQWLSMVPATEKAMPMAELGLLIGVSDAKQFDEGLKDLRGAINQLLTKLSELPGGFPPGVQLSAPAMADGLYWWEVPDGGILDKQILPTAGSGGAASVFALSKKHAARLVKPTPLSFRAKELEISGEVLGCCVLDWIGFIELVTPWVDYSISQSAKDFGADAKTAKRWAKEAETALMIFKTFKGSSCTTKKAEVGTVTRTVIVIKDIEAMPDPID
ncbi:MAG: hypothetical protein EBV06_11800 [Planctomycetia bacterium]|nr:hypothetical protein [Planctomycetia bacterium]